MQLVSRLIRRTAPASWALLGACLFGLAATPAQAQDTPPSSTVPFSYDTGPVANTSGLEQIVIAFPVKVGGADWMRLQFKSVELAGDVDAGTGAIVRITSLLDADAMTMNALHVAQWRNTSCYMNGEELLVEVIAQPNTGFSRIVMDAVIAGSASAYYSQCGPTDDRVASSDGRAARLLPIGCTGWIIDDCRSCMLTAGHCSSSSLQTAQFNVPLSTSGGGLVHPPASDQYSVDVSSKQHNGGQGVGNDWGYFGCFPNATTGLTPFGKQLVRYHLALPPSFNPSESIRITGYGTDSGSANQTQQTHSGPWVTLNGTTVQYKADTTGGNSGSPVVHEPSGNAIGIHTHGGCQTSGSGQNSGTASSHPALLAVLASPTGVCAGSGPCSAVGNNYCIPGSLFSVISATGSASVSANDLVLRANNIPVGKTGIFMYSLNKQSIVLVGNSGRLCVGGGAAIRRLPGVNSGAGTTFTFNLDYTALSPAGAILPGSTWNFQSWFRKVPGATETTNGLEISFVN